MLLHIINGMQFTLFYKGQQIKMRKLIKYGQLLWRFGLPQEAKIDVHQLYAERLAFEVPRASKANLARLQLNAQPK
eukprot:UN10064